MSNRLALVIAILCAMPGPFLFLAGIHLGTVADTSFYGLSIVSSAFLLAWAAEAAEVDIAQGLAVAFIALIAVLPEYAVDMTFAWKAGEDPEFAQYAVANMTGGNRLLIGAAWPLIFFLFWWRTRKPVLHLERSHAVEIVALSVATIYSFTLPLKDSITLVDTAVLATIFVIYVYIIARAPSEEPELVGPARMIGTLPRRQRRGSIIGLFAVAAGSIFASAEPFAEGLVHSGTQLGIDEFLLVQWLAPFASESPEFLVAGILAWRGRASVAMGALLSSKVNQWTLLIGGLPIAFALSTGTLDGLPLDSRQKEEVFLTAAQSFFAVAVLTSLSLSGRESLMLLGLFMAQFLVPALPGGVLAAMGDALKSVGVAFGDPAEEVRMLIGAIYVLLGIFFFLRERTDILNVLRLSRQAYQDPSSLVGAEEREAPV